MAARTYVDMDWDWLAQNAKLHRRQNRLGFVLAFGTGSRSSNERKRADVEAPVAIGKAGVYPAS